MALKCPMQEFGEQLAKLPEKGKEIVRSLSQHLSAHDWDLSERAMHALHNMASAPGAQHAFEVRPLAEALRALSPAVMCPAGRHPESISHPGCKPRHSRRIMSSLHFKRGWTP